MQSGLTTSPARVPGRRYWWATVVQHTDVVATLWQRLPGCHTTSADVPSHGFSVDSKAVRLLLASDARLLHR